MAALSVHVPRIIKFGYHDFRESRKIEKDIIKHKWHAKCNFCELEITETRGTTSSWVRYVLQTVKSANTALFE
jgi:hypothetical protein